MVHVRNLKSNQIEEVLKSHTLYKPVIRNPVAVEKSNANEPRGFHRISVLEE
jgi:hypothetical protein